MVSAVNFSNQAIGALVVRQTNIALTGQIVRQQQIADIAMIEKIDGRPARESAPKAQQREQDAPAPTSAKGAPEPGKGNYVDIVA